MRIGLLQGLLGGIKAICIPTIIFLAFWKILSIFNNPGFEAPVLCIVGIASLGVAVYYLIEVPKQAGFSKAGQGENRKKERIIASIFAWVLFCAYIFFIFKKFYT